MNLAPKIAEFRADIATAAKARWGVKWIPPLAKAAGWNERTLRTFLYRGKRFPPGDRLLALQAAVSAPPDAPGRVRESIVPYVAPEWQDREWQQTHAFTALVEALKDLERIPMTSINAWRTRVAWETLLCAGDVIRTLSAWKDRDWERIYRQKLDHWLRPKFGARAERTMLKERLSIQLELEEE